MTEKAKKTSHFNLIDGTSALSPSEGLEIELAKDKWDAHNIPGLRYAPHTSLYYIDFLCVPAVFRQYVKEYAKFLFAAGRAAGTLYHQVRCIGHFLSFFGQRYPGSAMLQDLREEDVTAYVLYLKTSLNARRTQVKDRRICEYVACLESFLSHLERVQSPVRPKTATACIIWPHHYPRWKKRGEERIKYIPQTVLKQLDDSLQHLTAANIPIVILLRASGWRISDVLYLKWDICLEQEGEKFSLVGDIQKNRVLGHKIPITQDVAVVVLTQIEWVKQHYTLEENPQNWLFPASKKQYGRHSQRFSRGDPRPAEPISASLNRLAKKYQIQDEQGKIFHFNLHAFRHTKAVELINNGMSLVMVQQWMAHASPEMTLIYAKILDETTRTQWEKTVQQGIVQFNDGKPEFVPGQKLLPMAGENGFVPERVREHRQNVKMALGSCLKTAKIMCKFVELPCFHCPAYVLIPEDLPALEAYEQQILERVEVGKQAGNPHWIEVNQKNLDERVRPAIALLRQGQVIAKAAKQEREYADEEWEQRQQNREAETHE